MHSSEEITGIEGRPKRRFQRFRNINICHMKAKTGLTRQEKTCSENYPPSRIELLTSVLRALLKLVLATWKGRPKTKRSAETRRGGHRCLMLHDCAARKPRPVNRFSTVQKARGGRRLTRALNPPPPRQQNSALMVRHILTDSRFLNVIACAIMPKLRTGKCAPP